LAGRARISIFGRFRYHERKMAKKLVALSLLVFLSFCAPGKKVRVEAPGPELEQKVAAADFLRERGCYITLKEAYAAYSELFEQASLRREVLPKLAVTAILLAVREKELGMASNTYIDKALELTREYPSLTGFVPYVEIAGVFWVQGKGIMRDIDERFPWHETEDKLKRMDDELREKAKADEFFAYMYTFLKCAYANPYQERGEFAELLSIFPGSLLLKYKQAICPRENADLLQGLLAEEPRFYEAEYFLGNLSLQQGLLLEAENHYLKAFEGIPESPQITISLGAIYLATEELERSLEYYEKTLALAPEYRDALLGKGICLSYLGKPEAAIDVMQKIIGLGHWLIGEAYYWLAWNEHELNKLETAAADIEQSKTRLPTSTEVFTLSGIIAFELGDLAKAERDFKEALQYSASNSEALFNLGSLYAKKENWKDSGFYFEKAGFSFEFQEKALREKMRQIEQSTMSPERKERLLRKKTLQLGRTSLTKATAFYNAAAGYVNSGQKYKGLEMATRAAEHPSFKAKAEELASGIKFPPQD
jgi:tetratricopeptide (TPR) repeat protein